MGGNTSSSSFDDDYSVRVKSRITARRAPIMDSLEEASQNLEETYLSNQCKLKNFSNILSVQEYTLKTKDTSISCMCSTYDGNYIFIGYHNGLLKKLLLNDKKICNYEKAVYKCGILSLAVSNDNKYLFAASKLGELKQINVIDGSIEYNWGTINQHRINCMKFAHDNKNLYIGSDFGHWLVLDICLRRILCFDIQNGVKEITAINESKIFNQIFLATKDDDLIICRRSLYALKLTKDTVDAYIDSPPSKQFRSGSSEKNHYESPFKKKKIDVYLEDVNEPLPNRFNNVDLENAIKKQPLNLEIVKLASEIHGTNFDKLLYIELSPEEETYFTGGYFTLLQWSTKSLTVIKDYTEILFFELKMIKISCTGEFQLFGQDFDVDTQFYWNVSNYSLLFNYTKNNIKKRKDLFMKEIALTDNFSFQNKYENSIAQSLKSADQLNIDQTSNKHMFNCYRDVFLCYNDK